MAPPIPLICAREGEVTVPQGGIHAVFGQNEPPTGEQRIAAGERQLFFARCEPWIANGTTIPMDTSGQCLENKINTGRVRPSFSAMFKTLRYYWIVARGYRLNPWKSPYLQWRFETFVGPEAAQLTPKKFFRLLWKYRAQMSRFVDWAAERRRAQRRRLNW